MGRGLRRFITKTPKKGKERRNPGAPRLRLYFNFCVYEQLMKLDFPGFFLFVFLAIRIKTAH